MIAQSIEITARISKSISYYRTYTEGRSASETAIEFSLLSLDRSEVH